MKISSWMPPSMGDPPPLIRLGLLLICFATLSQAITFDPVPSPNLDLSKLGRVGLAGDFNGISLYEYEGQSENGFFTNGSQSVMTQFPNGGFFTLASADAGIQAMCSFDLSNGSMAGVVVGGNFTSLGGIESQGAAMINPNTSVVTPLPGLSGQVYALLCDQDTSTVYVGGSFSGANSTNAIAWVGDAGWTNLPFAGFNGPVTSITKSSNGNIIFGGSFTGLGNATGPSEPDQQIINISNATITSGSSSSEEGFSDPSNIVCKTSGTDGAGNTWLLADNSTGFWEATFGFGFRPTKLRLWNTHQDGRGTETWRFTAIPLNGIMNFTYIDPITNQNASCSSECPLSSNSSIKYQDFHFVNTVGMDAFRIDISAWYGNGGGLDGIELFEDDIFSYAVNAFNEPPCAGLSTASTASPTGPWTVSPSLDSTSEYLTATLTGSNITASSASVVFLPDIRQSGNYTVNMYTPGCQQDNSCSTRGQVNITGVMSSTKSGEFNTEIFQTNYYDKYDQLYAGYIDAASTAFRPSVTLTPSSGQALTDLTVVAQRVGFTLYDSDGGLNSLFEYNPNEAVVDTSEFANSTIDQAGMSLGTGSGVSSLATSGSTTFVGGNFSTSTFHNIIAVSSTGTTALNGDGLNGEVLAMFVDTDNTILYVGGAFSNTTSNGIPGLNNIAAYDTSKSSWSALGAGVDGEVRNVAPLSINITANVPETAIALTGNFKNVLAFGSNEAIGVTGFAVWVPSQSNWLQNVNSSVVGVDGQLTAAVNITGFGYLYAGSLTSSQLSANGVAALSSGLSSFPVHIQPTQSQSSSTLGKRATSSQNITGVVTGLFYEAGSQNITILGGHFTATGSNGSDVNNLVFIDNANSDTVTGLGPQISSDSTVLSLGLASTTLWIGGSITGTVSGATINGLVAYDMSTSSFASQAPSLVGGSVSVNAIAVRPDSTDVYVGGSFTAAGSLQCPGVCLFQTSGGQWNRPGTNNLLAGTANTMMWNTKTTLLVGGSLTLNGANTNLATYDSKALTWTASPGQDAIPGPVTALTLATEDGSQLWVGGTATNNSAFVMKYDGTNWNSVGDAFGSGTTISGLQILQVTPSHTGSGLIPQSETLLIMGALVVPGFGNASAVLFDGTAFQPFALTTTASNTGGSLSQLFSQEQNFFAASGGHLAKGFVVLIALAIALALIFLMVVAGTLAERIRRKREGYMPAPTNSFDRNNGLSRIPPQELFSSLNQGRSAAAEKAPMI